MLTALLDGNAGVLDGETFQTLICEAEAIVNSRLLTLDNLSDPDSLAPFDAESHFNHENKAGFTTTWPLSKRRSVFEETMETSPAPRMPVLGPLEKGVLTKPPRKIQVDFSPPQPSDWRRGDC